VLLDFGEVSRIFAGKIGEADFNGMIGGLSVDFRGRKWDFSVV
jgi:hypothetical protein